MHENSETIKGRDGQWYNVYDGTPYPLPQIFGFEKQPYSTMEEAENKAAWRSASGYSEDYAKQPPQYGFSNTYQPSPQAKALGKVIEALEDPRNAWIGTGLAGGTIRGLGKLRGRLFQPTGPESGGFYVPSTQMRRDLGGVRPNFHKMEPPDPQIEKNLRADYHGTVASINELADKIRGGWRPMSEETLDALATQRPADIMRSIPKLEETVIGRNQLDNYVRMFPHTTAGQEGPPPDYILKRFGFTSERPPIYGERDASGVMHLRSKPSGQRGGTTSGGERYNYETQRWEPDDKS